MTERRKDFVIEYLLPVAIALAFAAFGLAVIGTYESALLAQYRMGLG